MQNTERMDVLTAKTVRGVRGRRGLEASSPLSVFQHSFTSESPGQEGAQWGPRRPLATEFSLSKLFIPPPLGPLAIGA